MNVVQIRSMWLGVGMVVLAAGMPGVAFGQTNDDVVPAVEAQFADAPIMVEVARCESRFRQFADSGNPLYGGYLGKMVGIFQIYKDVHEQDAVAMGFDLETIGGNIAYARYLYDKQGTDPWISSIACWGGTPVAEAATEATTGGGVVQTSVQVNVPNGSGTAAATLTKNLSLGMIDPEMRTVQQILNGAGFVLATEGPGSPGQETEKFGALTREALKRFQCEKGIVCEGNAYSTGYGFIGPRTRAALMAAASSDVSAPQESNTTQTVTGSVMTVVESASTTATTTKTTTTEAEQIAALQAQITELLKIIAALQAAQTQ